MTYQRSSPLTPYLASHFMGYHEKVWIEKAHEVASCSKSFETYIS